MNWISVKEKLPNHNDIVLVVSSRYYPSSAVFLKTKGQHGEEGYMWMDAHDSNQEYYDITHWMPLPEFPK